MRNLIFLSFLILLTGCVKSNPDITTPLKPVETIPNAPSNLSGVVNSSTQITLTWRDESTNESEFKIERKIGSGAFVIVGNTSKDITSFVDINLIPNTIYTYRVFSKNSYGNSNNHSNELNRSTTDSALTVTIGSQIWSKFNLDVTTYSDGTPIPQVSNSVEWSNLTTGAWCYYNNDTANGVVYGKLYNWYAVAGIHDNDPTTPNKTLAPSGWRIPSNNDWTELTNFLGAREVAGSKMKATGTTLWNATNIATNESGFTALPGGDRRIDGSFQSTIGNWTAWWSTTEYGSDSSLVRGLGILHYSPFSFISLSYKKMGLSVRCVFEEISTSK
jgi:uncharacterized protein (TIGR02145 family)